MHRIIHEEAPIKFDEKFQYTSGGSRCAEKCNLYLKKSKSHKQFYFLGAKCWNIVPATLKSNDDPNKFSKKYKNDLLASVQSNVNYKVENAFDFFYKVE